MKLVPLMTLRATLRRPADMVGSVPHGVRGIAEVTGGEFSGDRLRGTVRTPGGDWYLIDASGVLHLDVRATLETHDHALIYAQYYGRLVINDVARAAMEKQAATRFGDTYFVTQPRFETGHPSYTWLNSVMAVGEGRLTEDGVAYHIFECVHGD
jgi:hypothetical protein